MPRQKTVPERSTFDPDVITVGQAAAWLKEAARKKAGAVCPCCNEVTRHYCRTINNKMARTAIQLYRAYSVGSYVDITAFITYLGDMELMKGREWGRLALWGILEDDDTAEPRKGIYKLTEFGYNYVFNGAQVYKKLWTLKDRVVAAGNETATIRDALGKNFNYDEIMNTPLPGAAQ